MELGLHVANFTWDGGQAQLAPTLAKLAASAEQAGFARITVMDHVWQIGPVGPVEDPMLEAYTALGYLAAQTSRVQLHTLVTGVTYRDPGMLAKQISTLDVLTGGRAWLGIGAAWNEEESRGIGLFFPPLRERFERLEETLQICLQMWSGEDAPYEGRHYRLERTLNQPQPPRRPRIMVAGSGERKTLRLVARYADACNLMPGDDLRRKLDILREHCERERTDYDAIEKTTLAPFPPGADPAELVERLRGLHEQGFTAAYLMVGGPQPLEAVQKIGEQVIPEVSRW